MKKYYVYGVADGSLRFDGFCLAEVVAGIRLAGGSRAALAWEDLLEDQCLAEELGGFLAIRRAVRGGEGSSSLLGAVAQMAAALEANQEFVEAWAERAGLQIVEAEA